jgi:hypothetical protein
MNPLSPLIRPALVLLLAGIALLPAPTQAQPRLTEILASNQSGLTDEDGDRPDWIEIHNPGPDPLPLAGFSLSDDPDQPAQWTFPAVTLAPGAHLVVFASGKDRRQPSQPLHTNFRLGAEGEFLGLFAPDGTTLVSGFHPAFPEQRPDVSYGAPDQALTQNLLFGRPLQFLIPQGPTDVEPDWTQPGFTPGDRWQTGPGLGIGYDTTVGEAGENLARSGTASQSTTGYGMPAALALDGDLDTFTHTTSDDNASSWQVDLGRTIEVVRVLLHNRRSCCASRLRDIEVRLLDSSGTTVWQSDLLNPENTLGNPDRLSLDFLDLGTGPVTARTIEVRRLPDPDLSGSGGQGNEDEDNVLSLAEVEVFGAAATSLAPWIVTDVDADLRTRHASLLVRVPFPIEAETPPPHRLRLRYDDAVAVFLNGTEIADLQAPPSRDWNATAPQARPDADTLRVTEIDLAPHAGLFQTGTNILAFHGFNVASDDDDFLIAAELLQPGETQEWVYFEEPTPGAANDRPGYLGWVAEVEVAERRGLVTQAFDLTLRSTTPGATIHYTFDGSEPSPQNGMVYAGPIPIDRTRVVRAIASRPGYRPSPVTTATYIFPAQVATQPARPAGFPATWASVSADYGMDPRIVTNTSYVPNVEQSLRSLPSLSVVTETRHLFDSGSGIYANPENRGASWERPVSVEWLSNDHTEDWQVTCALRIQGGYFRSRDATQKHSLRLLFKTEFGPGKLRQDVFNEPGAAQEFDTLVLRAGANDGYSWNDARDTEQFLRDEFGRRLQLDMGHPASRGRFVHLYLNGLYWGIYNLCERPNEDFSSTYLDGAPEDWDSVNSGEVKSGSLDLWNQLSATLNRTLTLADFQRITQGNPATSTPPLLNLENYLDYMIVNLWGGNWDWPNKNFWFGARRGPTGDGLRFYVWDFENTMGNNRGRSPLDMLAPRSDIASSWVGLPHHRLRSLPEYRLRYADRVHAHFFGNGLLTPDILRARYRALAEDLAPAIVAESARWGDDHHAQPQTPADWQRELDWILNTYLPQRSGIVLNQFRAAGLYPDLDAPRWLPPSGSVASDTPIRLTGPSTADLYLTTTGEDPRLPGGSPHPQAVRIAAGQIPPPLFLSTPTRLQARAFRDGTWSALATGLFSPDLPAGGDLDKDGIPDLLEFALLPTSPGGPWLIARSVPQTTSTVLDLEIHVRPEADNVRVSWATADQPTGPWTEDPTLTPVLSETPLLDGTLQRHYTFPLESARQQPLFLRLILRPPL